MAAGPNSRFPYEAAARVVSAARELRLDMPADDLSVHDAWLVMAGDSWTAQQRREHTMALVVKTAAGARLVIHHRFLTDPDGLWPTCKRLVDLGAQGQRLPDVG